MYLFFLLGIFYLQDWIQAYQEETEGEGSNFYTWMAQTSQSSNAIDGSTVIFLSQMLKQNITIISDDNIWNCDGGLTDISFVYVGDNRFIATNVSTNMLTIHFQVKCLLFFFRFPKICSFWSSLFRYLFNIIYLRLITLFYRNWRTCEVGDSSA